MNRRTIIMAACCSLLVAPFVVLSTPPAPPPSHGFVVSGRVERGSPGSIARYAVVPRAWVGASSRPIRFGCDLDEYFRSRTLTLTNEQGEFRLYFWTCAAPETIAVAVVTPDSIFLGEGVPMDSLRGNYQVIEEEYSQKSGAGCDENTVQARRVRGYIFHVEDLIVNVP